MRRVVDTNILLTFFWKDSFTKGILIDKDFEFFSPEIALEEIKRNSWEIKRKTGISEEEFRNSLRELAIFVERKGMINGVSFTVSKGTVYSTEAVIN